MSVAVAHSVTRDCNGLTVTIHPEPISRAIEVELHANSGTGVDDHLSAIIRRHQYKLVTRMTDNPINLADGPPKFRVHRVAAGLRDRYLAARYRQVGWF